MGQTIGPPLFTGLADLPTVTWLLMVGGVVGVLLAGGQAILYRSEGPRTMAP